MHEKLRVLSNTSVENSMAVLVSVGPEIREVTRLALAQGKPDLVAYVIGRYAALHHNFERAEREFRKATAHAPDVLRYQYWVGNHLG